MGNSTDKPTTLGRILDHLWGARRIDADEKCMCGHRRSTHFHRIGFCDGQTDQGECPCRGYGPPPTDN